MTRTRRQLHSDLHSDQVWIIGQTKGLTASVLVREDEVTPKVTVKYEMSKSNVKYVAVTTLFRSFVAPLWNLFVA